MTDDEPRWLAALITHTSIRLSEAARLSKADVYLHEEVHYVDIRPHRWRRLKIMGIRQKILFIRLSLWAAKQAYASSIIPFLFPRYCNEKDCISNSASAALNKWLKQVAGSDYAIPSFHA